jgi:hypothetical protein
VALTGPALPLDPARKFHAPRRWCQNSLQPFRKAKFGRAHTECWHLFKVQCLVRRWSGGLAEPRPSGYHLSPLRGEQLPIEELFLILIFIVVSPSCSRKGKPRLRLRASVRTRRVHRRLPGCGAHRSRATPGSSPQIPRTPEVVPELTPNIWEGEISASSYGMLAPLQGAMSRPTLVRRSRQASTLRLPSVTPHGVGNCRLRSFFLILIFIVSSQC